jgi:hypothetical protein
MSDRPLRVVEAKRGKNYSEEGTEVVVKYSEKEYVRAKFWRARRRMGR